MIHLTEEEIKEAQDYKGNVVTKLLDFYLEFQSSPEERLRTEMKEMALVIADDFKKVREGGEGNPLQILGSNKDDKLFERIMLIFDKSAKIYESISVAEKKEDGKKVSIRKGHEDKPII